MENILFNKLPLDIIIYVSSYFDNIFYYKNRFLNINKININDKRYELINSIKKPTIEVLGYRIQIYHFLCKKNTNIGFHFVSIYDLNLQNTFYRIIKVKIGEFRGAYRKYLHDSEITYNIIRT